MTDTPTFLGPLLTHARDMADQHHAWTATARRCEAAGNLTAAAAWSCAACDLADHLHRAGFGHLLRDTP